MTKIKILHLFNAFQVGGVERLHMLLVERMKGMFDQTCWAYIEGPIQGELDELGIPHIVGGFDEVRGRIASGEFDCVVIRTHMYFEEIMDFFRTDDTPLIYIKDYLRWFMGNDTYIDPEFDSIICDRADKVFFCGPQLRDGVLQNGIVPKDFQMLYNGIELSDYPMKARSLKENNEPITISILANIIQRKNQIAAIRALKPELEKGSVHLKLGGDVRDRDFSDLLKKEAEGLNVSFEGYISDTNEFLMNTDILLMTSKLEGWPVVLMEAMASGVPVIAPDIGDIRELLQNGEAGFIYPDGEYYWIREYVKLLTDSDIYRKLSVEGLERVREFGIDKSLELVTSAIWGVASANHEELRAEPAISVSEVM